MRTRILTVTAALGVLIAFHTSASFSQAYAWETHLPQPQQANKPRIAKFGLAVGMQYMEFMASCVSGSRMLEIVIDVEAPDDGTERAGRAVSFWIDRQQLFLTGKLVFDVYDDGWKVIGTVSEAAAANILTAFESGQVYSRKRRNGMSHPVDLSGAAAAVRSFRVYCGL